MARRSLGLLWSGKVEEERARHLHKIRQLDEDAEKLGAPFIVWLGGPKKGHKLYFLRRYVREMLRKQKFTVVFSEHWPRGADILSKEREEVQTANAVIILAVSPGSSAEAIEFAYTKGIQANLHVFLPKEFTAGYVARSLEAHRLLPRERLFSLKHVQLGHPDLALKVARQVLQLRRQKYSALKIELDVERLSMTIASG